MKSAIQRYVSENYDDLLNLDMTLARLLGAPAPHTLSSYAFLKSPFWRMVIDLIFWVVWGQKNHCEKDYERVTKLIGK